MNNSYSLIRGCALFHSRRDGEASYLLGTLDRVATVTSPFQRSAITQLAMGKNPFANIPPEHVGQLEDFIATLDAHRFLNHRKSELAPPKRYLDEVATRDRAFIQLRTRSAPELAQIEWAESGGDGGCSTLAAGAAGFTGAETGVATGADTAAATGAATGGATTGAATGFPVAFKTSSFLTRPLTPEPEIVEISIPFSLASCLTIGVA